MSALEDAQPGEDRAAGVEDGAQGAEDPPVGVREVTTKDRRESDQGGGDEDRRRPEPGNARGRSHGHAFAAFLVSVLSAFCLMKRSVFAWASLSTICTGGDFMR